MIVHFFKYHGTGNDFIIIDNRDRSFDPNNHILISKLCDRHFGIGADGMMLFEEHGKYDFEMIYFNSDGKRGSMCGNGGRCIISFAKKTGIITKSAQFIANGKTYKGMIENDIIRLNMQDVDTVDEFSLTKYSGFLVNTGSPHFVTFVDDVEKINVVEVGRKIRNQSFFKNTNGVNVDFVKIIDDNKIFVRTYERGVEDETYSCGTGVVASAIATYYIRNSKNTEYQILTKGGKLKVYFEKSGIFKNIVLEGWIEHWEDLLRFDLKTGI